MGKVAKFITFEWSRVEGPEDTEGYEVWYRIQGYVEFQDDPEEYDGRVLRITRLTEPDPGYSPLPFSQAEEEDIIRHLAIYADRAQAELKD